MSSNRFGYSVFAVLVVLAFTFTMAGAQAEPTGSITGGDMEVPDISDFTVLPEGYTPSGDLSVDVVDPQPISPFNNIIFTKLPKFYFTRNVDASEYRISVVDIVATPDKLIYTYTGAGNCGTAYCWLQPTKALKTVQYEATKGGVYVWAVEAMIGGDWQPISSTALFFVFAKGFNSSFNVNAAKWMTHQGTWTINSGAFYKTNGIYNTGVSIMQKELFVDGVVYEVKMKRKVDYGSNRIIIHGDPTPFFGTNIWDDGYYFQYTNSGDWSLYKMQDGASSIKQGWTLSPYVEEFGWNTLTVWRIEDNIHLWLNGVYMGYFVDSSFTIGFVGIGMYQDTNGKAPLLVDNARAYYSAVFPYAVPLTDAGEVDPAYELVPSGTTAGDIDGSR